MLHNKDHLNTMQNGDYCWDYYRFSDLSWIYCLHTESSDVINYDFSWGNLSQKKQKKLQRVTDLLRSFDKCCCSYLITVPLAPPAVVSMTLVVRLTRRSSWSRPSRSAQYSRVWPDWFFRTQPPETHSKTHKILLWSVVLNPSPQWRHSYKATKRLLVPTKNDQKHVWSFSCEWVVSTAWYRAGIQVQWL